MTRILVLRAVQRFRQQRRRRLREVGKLRVGRSRALPSLVGKKPLQLSSSVTMRPAPAPPSLQPQRLALLQKRRRDRSPGRTAGLKQGGKEVVSKSMEPTSTKLKAISDRMLSETERGQV